jgi:hypothetical protein
MQAQTFTAATARMWVALLLSNVTLVNIALVNVSLVNVALVNVALWSVVLAAALFCANHVTETLGKCACMPKRYRLMARIVGHEARWCKHRDAGNRIVFHHVSGISTCILFSNGSHLPMNLKGSLRAFAILHPKRWLSRLLLFSIKITT